jgi:hypothetical protein
LPPEIAWPYLKRVGEVVLPEAARSAPAAEDNALSALLSDTGT